MSETLLTLNLGGFPPKSARGCIQILSPLQRGAFRRTPTGRLIYTGNPYHQKYASTVSCIDKTALAIEGLWRGTLVSVGCIQELCQELQGDILKKPFTLRRPAVSGSVWGMDENQNQIPITELTSQTMELTAQTSLASETRFYIYYRPILEMLVVDFTLTTNEWRDTVGWVLKLEEI